MLGQLLGGAVQQADVRIGALDHLAVQFQHQAQHAVRGGVLRAKIQGVIFNLGHSSVPASRVFQGGFTLNFSGG